jgi:aminopeptidase N
VRRAPSGSGRALAAARAFVAASADAAALRSWLAGEVPNGVVLDVELRWAVVRRLCELGELSAAELAEEARLDHSTEGEVHAARCAASRPDPEAKQAAWQTLMCDPEASNSLLYANAQGFWQPGQDALTDLYVGRFFDEIAATARLRSGWVLGRLAGLAYPRTAVRAATVIATDDLLTRPGLAPGIRRGVLDAGDDLRRAVRSRERFGSRM